MRRIQSAGRAQLMEFFYDTVAGRRSLVVAAEQGDPPARAARSGGDVPHRTEDAGDGTSAVQWYWIWSGIASPDFVANTRRLT
jgi:hypothetical protein